MVCSRKYDAAPARVKAPFSDRFFRPCCFSCTCAALGTPFSARGRTGPPLLRGNNVRESSVERRRATTSAPLLLFPDLIVVSQQTTNLTWKHICSYTCGPRSQRLVLPTRSHASHSLGQRHCSVKPSPVHPNAEAVTVLVHIFAEIERLTNTQRTHRKPPLSSSTPSPRPSHIFDKFDATVSPAQVASAFAHEGGTHTGNAYECTSWEDARGLHTETTAHCTRAGIGFSQHTPPQRILQPRTRGRTEGSSRDEQVLTDESVLVRPTDAQKPEPGTPIRSVTGADRTPSEHCHPAISKHACMVSDAFPTLVSRIVAIWSPGCSLLLTDRLPLPPSAPSFPPPPHRCDDDRNHCVRQKSVVACGSQTAQIVCVCVPFVVSQSSSRAKCRILIWAVD